MKMLCFLLTVICVNCSSVLASRGDGQHFLTNRDFYKPEDVGTIYSVVLGNASQNPRLKPINSPTSEVEGWELETNSIPKIIIHFPDVGNWAAMDFSQRTFWLLEGQAYTAYAYRADKLSKHVRTVFANSNDNKSSLPHIIFTGRGAAGAVAALSALDFLKVSQVISTDQVKVITFFPKPLGDQAFAEVYNRVINRCNHIAFVYDDAFPSTINKSSGDQHTFSEGGYPGLPLMITPTEKWEYENPIVPVLLRTVGTCSIMCAAAGLYEGRTNPFWTFLGMMGLSAIAAAPRFTGVLPKSIIEGAFQHLQDRLSRQPWQSLEQAGNRFGLAKTACQK